MSIVYGTGGGHSETEEANVVFVSSDRQRFSVPESVARCAHGPRSWEGQKASLGVLGEARMWEFPLERVSC